MQARMDKASSVFYVASNQAVAVAVMMREEGGGRVSPQRSRSHQLLLFGLLPLQHFLSVDFSINLPHYSTSF
jgi:hypothetical protein